MVRHIIENEVIPYTVYGGDWDPTTGEFPLTCDTGDIFHVSVSGTHAAIDFYAGDYIVCVTDTPDAGTFIGNWQHVSRTNPDEMSYKGVWDAASGALPGGGAAKAGHMYLVSGSGTVDSQAFALGDLVLAIVDNAPAATYAGNWQVIPVSGAAAATSIQDADGDTKVQVESSADEDVIRMDVAGVETMTVDASTGATLFADLKFNTTTTGPILVDNLGASWRLRVDSAGNLSTETV